MGSLESSMMTYFCSAGKADRECIGGKRERNVFGTKTDSDEAQRPMDVECVMHSVWKNDLFF